MLHFSFNSRMMYLLVQKRFDLHFFTKATVLLFCSGVSKQVRPQFAYFSDGMPRLRAATLLTAFSKARCRGTSPLTVRTCFRTSSHGSFDLFRKNQAFAAWKGSSPLGCNVTVHFVMADDVRMASYRREPGVLEQHKLLHWRAVCFYDGPSVKTFCRSLKHPGVVKKFSRCFMTLPALQALLCPTCMCVLYLMSMLHTSR